MKVLIIQDDKETLEDISQAFQMCWPDAELISTPFGRRGIAQVRSESPEMVILDMNLPDMSGFDALKQVRCCSKVPVIVLSFLKGESGIVKSLGLGADAYIVKPFRQLEFIGHVRVLLRKGNLNGV